MSPHHPPPPGSTLLLRGHVDPGRVAEFRKQGGEEDVRKMALSAMKRSKDRAAEIKRLLVEREKVDAARVEAVGRGWEEPAGPTQSENMRVEVQWFTLEWPGGAGMPEGRIIEG